MPQRTTDKHAAAACNYGVGAAIGKEQGKGTARTELSAIRAVVDPLHKAARLRDSTERQAAEIAGIEATIRELKKRNRDLLRIQVLEIEPGAKESCRREATPDAQEVTYSDSDSEKLKTLSKRE